MWAVTDTAKLTKGRYKPVIAQVGNNHGFAVEHSKTFVLVHVSVHCKNKQTNKQKSAWYLLVNVVLPRVLIVPKTLICTKGVYKKTQYGPSAVDKTLKSNY